MTGQHEHDIDIGTHRDADFGAEIDKVIAAHRAPRVEALFVWPIVAWTLFGMTGVAVAAYWATK